MLGDVCPLAWLCGHWIMSFLSSLKRYAQPGQTRHYCCLCLLITQEDQQWRFALIVHVHCLRWRLSQWLLCIYGRKKWYPVWIQFDCILPLPWNWKAVGVKCTLDFTGHPSRLRTAITCWAASNAPMWRTHLHTILSPQVNSRIHTVAQSLFFQSNTVFISTLSRVPPSRGASVNL